MDKKVSQAIINKLELSKTQEFKSMRNRKASVPLETAAKQIFEDNPLKYDEITDGRIAKQLKSL